MFHQATYFMSHYLFLSEKSTCRVLTSNMLLGSVSEISNFLILLFSRLLRLFGKVLWEICRCVPCLGVSWNHQVNSGKPGMVYLQAGQCFSDPNGWACESSRDLVKMTRCVWGMSWDSAFLRDFQGMLLLLAWVARPSLGTSHAHTGRVMVW